MKVNLTKKNIADLELAVKFLGKATQRTQPTIKVGKLEEGESPFTVGRYVTMSDNDRKEAERLSVDLQNILIKHDERKDKEY